MRTKKVILYTALALLLLIAFAWIGKTIVIEPHNYKTDFYWIWYGSQALIHQESPYGEQAIIDIHMFFIGKPPEAGQYTHPFPFPAYLSVVFLPFGLIPYPAALIIWIGLQFPLLFLALYLIKDFLDLELQGAKFILYMFAGSIGFFYPVLSYSIGQLAIFMLFLFGLTFYLLKKEKIGWAGVVLAFMAIRPDLFILASLTSIIFLWNSIPKIKKLVLSTSISLVTMNLVTVFLIGFWYPDWINTLTYYATSNPFAIWGLDTVSNMTINYTIAAILALTIISYLIWLIFFSRYSMKDEIQFSTISTIIIAYFFVTKITGAYYLTLLLIPALILFHFYSKINAQWIIWIILFSPWFYWLFIDFLNPWAGKLYFPLSLLLLQIIYTSITQYNLSKAVPI